MNELALFAGAGGGILGGHLLKWRTVCAVEWEQYPASVLCARQNDKILPPFPIWDDVQTFDGKPWRGIVDVVSGGFPCQDISAAGKGAGIEGNKSSMWKHMARIIGEVRPQFVFVENSPMLTSRGLGTVLADLSSMGFNAKWGVVSAADIGANHQRERIWIRAEQRNILSHTKHNGFGWRQQQSESIAKTVDMANANCKQSGSLEGGRSNINGGEECNHIQRIFDVDERSLQKQIGQILADTDSLTSKIRRDDFANEEISGKRGNNRDRSGGDDFRELDTKEDDTMADSNEYGTQSQSSNTGKPSEWIDSSGIAGRNQDVTDSMQSGLQGGGEVWQTDNEIGQNAELWRTAAKRSWWTTEPNVGRVANGLAGRVDRLKAIGNGQVPLCAATAWELLK